MNALVAASTDEHLVMLNDDVLPADPAWLRALMDFAVEPWVGGVGARLHHPDGRLQHAGIAPAFGRVAHLWARRPDAEGSYLDWALVQRQWSMVTGAVFATRRSALARVGGFDERFSLEFNDIDLCLRLRTAGLAIVYQPEARLSHVEKASRGEAPPPGPEIAAFLTRWHAWLAQDPAWHPMFERHAMEPVPRHVPDAWYF
jgi:GT2 family glycosyltransferase